MSADTWKAIVGILGAIMSGLLIWAIKDLIATLRNLTSKVTILETKFDVFKERTDDVPEIKKNTNLAHDRINKIDYRVERLENKGEL